MNRFMTIDSEIVIAAASTIATVIWRSAVLSTKLENLSTWVKEVSTRAEATALLAAKLEGIMHGKHGGD